MLRVPGERLRIVATYSHNARMQAGIRELRDNLSRYIRRIESGERIVITVHGRAVAELVPPGTVGRRRIRPIDRLVASGVIAPAEEGDPLEEWPDIRLPAGTAADLIDSDREEA